MKKHIIIIIIKFIFLTTFSPLFRYSLLCSFSSFFFLVKALTLLSVLFVCLRCFYNFVRVACVYGKIDELMAFQFDYKRFKTQGSTEGDKTCRSCGKIVYKMEEIKAEKSVWHKNCFRCSQCSKPLR